MLCDLNLRDFLFIEHAEISFGSGFCVLTGETGAGKSLLLDALSLSLGGRSDSAMVRPGAARAEVVASFKAPDTVQHWLSERDLRVDDEAILRRVVDKQGRSRAYINGSPVTVAQLRECGLQLLEIHGQHASQALLQNDGQRRLLDAYGRLHTLSGDVEKQWQAWRAARLALGEATAGEHERQQALADIDWRLEELDKLAPGDDEWQALSDEQTRLAHGQRLIESASTVSQSLAGDQDTVRERIDNCMSELRSIERFDPAIGEIATLLETARIHVDEAADALARYAGQAELDPARLHTVEARVSEWFGLARKLRLAPEQLGEHVIELRARRETLEDAGDLDALTQACHEAEVHWHELAQSLTKARKQAAKALTQKVSQQLPDLGMAQAGFAVELEACEPGPFGLERVILQFSGHPSLPARPLARVASGGELSRISLAISVAAANANPVQSLIFDEADAGIGGSVGDAIGRLMRRLGGERQILAVTHLAQVASCAHWHLRVSRTAKTGHSLKVLDQTERIEEIARMLGGGTSSKTSREHARELIEQAHSSDSAPQPSQEKPTPRAGPRAKPKPKTTSKPKAQPPLKKPGTGTTRTAKRPAKP